MQTPRKIITLDRERLETLAGLKFSDASFAELVELTATVAGKFQGPAPPDFMLEDAWSERWHQEPRQIEMDVRRAFVEAIDALWHECGGKGRGSYYDGFNGIYSGQLLALLRELFRILGWSDSTSAASLHHDLTFLATGRERERSRKRKKSPKRKASRKRNS